MAVVKPQSAFFEAYGSAGYAVLDLRSGRVLHEGTGDLPQLLVPDPA